jgi:hypothetical protein
MRDEFDVSFLSKMPEKEHINFKVTFSRWLGEDAALVERAWALTEGPDTGAAGAWRENGLRIGWASGEDARAIRAIFKRAATLRQSQQMLVVPARKSFEVLMGGPTAATSLIYSSDGTTVFSDVTDLQQALRVAPEMSADGFRIRIQPFFYTGTGRARATDIGGAVATVPFSEGGLIIAGPAADPQEFRLGSLLGETDAAGRWSVIMVIEPKLAF